MTTARQLQCTEIAQRPGGGPWEWSLCELADGHSGDHADLIGDPDRCHWHLWRDEDTREEIRPPCEFETDDLRDACTHFRGHPGPHSWDITDPTGEAVWHLTTGGTPWRPGPVGSDGPPFP